MRSRGAWKMHYFTTAIGGANSQFIYENALPTLFLIDPTVPDPDMCVVFTAGNDAPVTGSANLVPATTYNRMIAETLLGRGITPIFVADPPRINAGNQTEMCRYFEKWAMVSQDLAKEYGCPWVNAYGATVNASNGQPLTGVTIADGTHLTAFGAELIGWALNEAIREHIGPSNLATRVFPFWSDTTLTYRSENPAFMDALAAGTINTAGSRPGGWSAPGVVTQGTVFDVANTPTPKPQIQTSPMIGTRTEPAYQGYAFQLAGDGTNAPVTTKAAVAAAQGVAAVAGDKMAVSFRIKWVPDPAVVTQTGDIDVIARSAGQQAAGLVITQTVNQNDDTYQIGGTTDYPAGDFYQEFIARGAGPYYESLWMTRRTGGASNANDRLTIANMSIINLTSAGLA
jgi:lysophospholipase L1-like esterase